MISLLLIYYIHWNLFCTVRINDYIILLVPSETHIQYIYTVHHSWEKTTMYTPYTHTYTHTHTHIHMQVGHTKERNYSTVLLIEGHWHYHCDTIINTKFNVNYRLSCSIYASHTCSMPSSISCLLVCILSTMGFVRLCGLTWLLSLRPSVSSSAPRSICVSIIMRYDTIILLYVPCPMRDVLNAPKKMDGWLSKQIRTSTSS